MSEVLDIVDENSELPEDNKGSLVDENGSFDDCVGSLEDSMLLNNAAVESLLPAFAPSSD
jgi:hypothetical protein